MYKIGIDIGSTFTKYCVLENSTEELVLFSEQTPIRQREYFADKLAQLQQTYQNCSIVTCGYGRKNIGYDKTISELTALSAGAARQCPETPVILDIGGQDTKVVRQENGKLKAFFVNEKCAAGCGLFLRNVLHLLQTDFGEIDLTGVGRPELRLSSVCAVFAQSEIVELLAAGASSAAIIQGVLAQIFVQAKTLLGKVDCSAVTLSGGLTKIPGVREFAEQILDKQVVLPEKGTYLSAIGCAMAELK